MNMSTAPPVSIGTPVFTSDGSRIGDVVGVATHFFVVEKGLLLTTDLHLPLGTVDGTDADGIHLTLTDAELEAGDWALPPAPDVPIGRERPSGARAGGGGGMPQYVGAGMNGENGYDHHALLKKP